MNIVELLDDCNNSLGEGITYSLINNNLYMASKAIKYSYYYKQVTNRAKRNISLINK